MLYTYLLGIHEESLVTESKYNLLGTQIMNEQDQ